MHNLHISAIKYSLPNLHKSSIPRNCIEFDNDACCNAATLNSQRDLDPDCSATSFLAHWNAGRPTRQCGVNGVQALCPAGTQSHCLRYGELPTINLVRVRSHSNKHVHFSTWLHKHKFWNSNRNHNALREMFSYLQQSLGRHLTLWPHTLNFVWTNHMC